MRYLLAVLLLGGCVSTQKYERDTQERYSTGYALGQSHGGQTCAEKVKDLTRMCAKSNDPDYPSLSTDFATRLDLANIEECLKVSANLDTPDFVRRMLFDKIKALRTRIQDRALGGKEKTP